MIEITSNIKTLLDVFNGYNALKNQYLSLRFDTDGLHCVHIDDDGRICLLALLIGKKDFVKYEGIDKLVKRGVNIVDALKILKNNDFHENVDIILEEKGVWFKFHDPEKRFWLENNFGSEDTNTIPDALEVIKYPNSVTMETLEFANIVNNAKIYGETLSIDLDKTGRIRFYHKWNDDKEEYPFSVEYDTKSKEIEELLVTEDCTYLTFATMYLDIILKGFTSSKIVLFLNDNTPMKISDHMGNKMVSQAHWFLAPRIDEPDEEDD
jgi:hypothetical protein